MPRFGFTTLDIPKPATKDKHFPGRVCVITDDERGMAENLARLLHSSGEQPVLLRHSAQGETREGNVYTADLTNPGKVEAALQMIREEYGAIGALVHAIALRPERPFADLKFNEWQQLVQLQIKSLYALVRSTQTELEQRGRSKGAVIAVATGMGGTFAVSPSENMAPSHAGVAAFLKTFALEAPNISCKAIDVNPSEPAHVLADLIRSEISEVEGPLEVGYAAGRRVTVVPQLATLDQTPDAGSKHKFDTKSVMLITGGARGITAEVSV